MVMPTFWELLDRVKDETGTSEAWILKKAGLNHGAFSAWRARGIPVLPPRRQLLLLAQAMRVDYAFLIDVLLHDTGYLPQSRAINEEYERARWLSRGDPVAAQPDLSDVDDEIPAAAKEGVIEEPGEFNT